MFVFKWKAISKRGSIRFMFSAPFCKYHFKNAIGNCVHILSRTKHARTINFTIFCAAIGMQSKYYLKILKIEFIEKVDFLFVTCQMPLSSNQYLRKSLFFTGMYFRIQFRTNDSKSWFIKFLLISDEIYRLIYRITGYKTYHFYFYLYQVVKI